MRLALHRAGQRLSSLSGHLPLPAKRYILFKQVKGDIMSNEIRSYEEVVGYLDLCDPP